MRFTSLIYMMSKIFVLYIDYTNCKAVTERKTKNTDVFTYCSNQIQGCPMISDHCKNNSTCLINADCILICKCRRGFYGASCDRRLTSERKQYASRNNTSSDQSILNLELVRLPRNTVKPRDECLDIHRMTFSCFGHGECVVTQIDGMSIPKCICDLGWRGLMCLERSPGIVFPTTSTLNRTSESTFTETNFLLNTSVAYQNSSDVPDSGQNSTSRRDVCEGIHETVFNCQKRGRCFIESVEGMKLPTCECDDLYSGRYCDETCNRKCHNNGSCKFHNLKEICYCVHGYEGFFCEKKKPILLTTSTYQHKFGTSPVVVSATAGACAFVVLMAIVAMVILWRKRVLLVMKLVYRFQRYEDDDAREYDAFISYKSSSRDNKASPEEVFVAKTLLPKLEREMGFKICVHFRDFIPGLSISDNVLYAIQNSRRTIMLVSEAYVNESVWCKFEFQQAQIAMLEQKQRIIPILYEDISQNDITDQTLKRIMQTITYVEKPVDMDDPKRVEEFWTRVCLSMPKKKANLGGVELNWQESCDSTCTQITTVSGDRTSVHSGDNRPSTTADSGIEGCDLISTNPFRDLTHQSQDPPDKLNKNRLTPEILSPANLKQDNVDKLISSQTIPMKTINTWVGINNNCNEQIELLTEKQ